MMFSKNLIPSIGIALLLAGCGQVDTGDGTPYVPPVGESSAGAGGGQSFSSGQLSTSPGVVGTSTVPGKVTGLWLQEIQTVKNYTHISADGVRNSYSFDGNNCYNVDPNQYLEYNGEDNYTMTYENNGGSDNVNLKVAGGVLTFELLSQGVVTFTLEYPRVTGLVLADIQLCDTP